MKKFQFSLKKLQTYKDQLLKKEKNELASLRKKQAALILSKNEMLAEHESINNRLNGKTSMGITPSQIQVYKNYLSSLNEKIKKTDLEIDFMSKKVKYQLDKVVEIMKELNTYEKLEEKQYDEYKKASTKAEELFIEEFVSHTSNIEDRLQ